MSGRSYSNIAAACYAAAVGLDGFKGRDQRGAKKPLILIVSGERTMKLWIALSLGLIFAGVSMTYQEEALTPKALSAALAAAPAGEIGRASCRERVWIWAVEGEVDE